MSDIVKREPVQIIPIVPRNYDEVYKMATMMAKTNMVPKDFINKEANIVVAIQLGLEVGLLPMQALQNIAVINGRPCVWGDAMLALVRASGLLESFLEQGDTDYATCEAKRFNEPHSVKHTFTKQDAERAGLWNKEIWKKYPQRMLQMRARGWVLRDLFADVLKGIGSAEEQRDIIDVDSVEVKEVEKVDVTVTKLKEDNLDALKEEKDEPANGKTGTLTEPANPEYSISDERAEPPDDHDDDIPIPDLIDELEASAFLARARNLAITTKDMVAFVKKKRIQRGR